MKNIIYILTFCVALSACADRVGDIKHAKRYGADARIVLRCVDQDGISITNANVSSALYPDGSFENAIVRNGATDRNGCFIMEGKTNGEFSYSVEKIGYYKTREDKYLFKDSAVSVSDGRWQPYGATNTVVLKRIVNPVAMYVEPYTRKIMTPKHNEWIGFDLQANDFVHPNGNGNTADFLVRYDFESGRNVLFYRGEVSLMTTNAFDGIYRMEKDKSSAMTTVYAANTNTTFATEMRFAYNRLIDKVVEDTRLPDNSYLVLRVRSRVDKEGNLVSAHYAKLIGPIEADEGGVWFAYYFNPNENDTNLEADTSKNLLPPHRLGFSP